MQKYEVYRRGLWAGAVAIALVAFNGCGGGDRPKTIPIDGHVTIDGKPPGETGKIFFAPTAAAEGYSKRPASGSFNAQGHYRVMSWAPDDGLVPGHYEVSVLPNDPDKTAVPTKYLQGASSGLELDVSVDKSKIDFDIDVKSKQPASH